MSDPDILIRRLARQIRDLSGKYTLAFGPEDNSARVLNLISGDAAMLGARILAVLDTDEDPGDNRFVCWERDCIRPQEHSGEHRPRDIDIVKTGGGTA